MESRRGAAASYLATKATDPSTAKWLDGVRSNPVIRRLRAGEGVNVCESNGFTSRQSSAQWNSSSTCSLRHETSFDMPLLSTAVYAGSMDCAHFLFPTETRREQRDQAMVIAVQRDEEEFVRLLLDEALSSNERAFQQCVSKACSPVILDLLLTRLCVERFSFNSVASRFHWCCRQAQADLAAVFVVHGIDVNAQVGLETALLNAVADVSTSNPAVVQLLVDSGANVNSADLDGRTVLYVVEHTLESFGLSADARARFEASRDILRGQQRFCSR